MTTLAKFETVPAVDDRMYGCVLSPWETDAVDGSTDGSYVARFDIGASENFLGEQEFFWMLPAAQVDGGVASNTHGFLRLNSGSDDNQNRVGFRLSVNTANSLGFRIVRSGTPYTAYLDGSSLISNAIHGQWRLMAVKRIKAGGGGDHEIAVFALSPDDGTVVTSGWTTVPLAHIDLDIICGSIGGEFRVMSYSSKSGGYSGEEDVMQSTPIIARVDSGTTIADMLTASSLTIEQLVQKFLCCPRTIRTDHEASFDRIHCWRLRDSANSPVHNKAGLLLDNNYSLEDMSASGARDMALTVSGTVYAMPEFAPSCRFPGFQFTRATAGGPTVVPFEGGFAAAHLSRWSNKDRLGLWLQTYDVDGLAVDWATPQLALLRRLNAAQDGLETKKYTDLDNAGTDSHKVAFIFRLDDPVAGQAYGIGLGNHSLYEIVDGSDLAFGQQAIAIVHDDDLCPVPTFADEMAGDAQVGTLTHAGNEAQYRVGCTTYPRAIAMGDRAVVAARSLLTNDGAAIFFMYDHLTETWNSKVVTGSASGVSGDIAGIMMPPVALDNGRVVFLAGVRDSGSTGYPSIMGLIGDCTSLVTFNTDARWTAAIGGAAITVGATKMADDDLNMWTENIGVAAADRDNCRIIDATRRGDHVVGLISYGEDDADQSSGNETSEPKLVHRRWRISGNALEDTDADGGWLDISAQAEQVLGVPQADWVSTTLSGAVVAIGDSEVIIALPDKATAVVGSGAGEPFNDRNNWGATFGFIGVVDTGSELQVSVPTAVVGPSAGNVAVSPSSGYNGIGAYPTTLVPAEGWYDNANPNEEGAISIGAPVSLVGLIVPQVASVAAAGRPMVVASVAGSGSWAALSAEEAPATGTLAAPDSNASAVQVRRASVPAAVADLGPGQSVEVDHLDLSTIEVNAAGGDAVRFIGSVIDRQ